MNGLLGSSALPWDQPAAAHEGQPALGTSTLGRLGSSYLDADCILDNYPSRDTFLLPDDADEPPAPLSRQHIVSTTSANLPPNTSSQPPPAGPPAGMQLAGAHAGGDMLSSGACRVPARLSMHLSTAGAAMRRTAGVSPHTVPSSSGAWEKPGAGMLLSSAHAANSSSRPGAQSPLVSARTVAALMAGEDDLQQANLDLLGMDGALLPLEGDLLWGAGAQALPDSTPPAVPGAGAQAQYGAAPPAPGARSLVVGQQYQQSHQAHQQALQQQHQLRLLGTASPVGLGQLGSRKGPAGSPATGYGSPAAQSRPHAPLVDAYHPQYQQYQQQQAAYSQRQPHLQQQQQQPWQDGRAAAWQQHQQQLQHAYLAQRQQQQLCAHPGHGSSSRPVARVLHPVGLQPGRTLHAGGIQQHTQQLQQQPSAHQHMHQQQQVHAQTQVHGMQQQQPTQQGSMSSPAGWQSTAAAASAGNQGPVGLINGFPAAAAVVQPTVAGSNATVAAALHTWGSNTSSMTAAADAAGSPGGTTTTAAAGGGGVVRSSEAPADSSAPAATAVSLAAGSSNEQQRQVVARSILASAGSGTQQFQAATLAALENCFPAPPAGTGVVQGQETKEQQQLPQLLALAQGSNGAAATAPQDASSLAAAPTATATGVGASAPPPPPAAAAAAETTASAPAGTLAAAANAAASPLKGPNSGAGVVSLSSANSGSMGDSSHDSSQTQQQDAGSAELPAAAATGLSAPVAAACAVAPAAKAAAAGAAAGAADAATAAAPVAGEEGAAGPTQPRVFHHKGGGPCDHCGVMESPQWRRGPPAKPILCNACGTRYRRTHHLGPPIPSGGRVGGPRPPAAGSSGGSSGGGSTPGRKRAAAAEALGPAPLPVNFEGGVHTGTRRARNPNRPAPKQYRIEDV